VCCRTELDIVAVIKLRTTAGDQNREIRPLPLTAMTWIFLDSLRLEIAGIFSRSYVCNMTLI